MELNEIFDLAEKKLTRFKNVIGLVVIIFLIISILLTVKNFEKQNEIIETGGYTDGKIKCVCSQEAWDKFISEKSYTDINLSIKLEEEING